MSSLLGDNSTHRPPPSVPQLLNDASFLSICISGFLFGLVGLILYFTHPSPNTSPYLLTLPPTAVTCYVFVVNFFKVHNVTQLPSVGTTVLEIVCGTLASTAMFAVFSAIQIPIIWGIMKVR